MERRRVVGIVLVVVSAAGFASGTVLSKPIYAAGLDWLQLLAWRFAIGAALAWGWLLVVAPRRLALARLGRRQAVRAAGLGVWYTGNAGTYYAGLETVPASLAGVLVYLYPAIVAVLSIRYATRLSGRRPWIALGIALVGVVLALGGIDLEPPPPVSGLLLILASPVIYAGWIILSARLAG
jgi:drug/metabolite transporter (DMT)-like permease